MAQTIKKAMAAAKDWIQISIGFAIISIPINLLMGRPVLNGLWHDWVVADAGLRWQLLGLVLGVLLAAWVVLTLLFTLGYGLNGWLKQQDHKSSN